MRLLIAVLVATMFSPIARAQTPEEAVLLVTAGWEIGAKVENVPVRNTTPNHWVAGNNSVEIKRLSACRYFVVVVSELDIVETTYDFALVTEVDLSEMSPTQTRIIVDGKPGVVNVHSMSRKTRETSIQFEDDGYTAEVEQPKARIEAAFKILQTKICRSGVP